MERHICSAPRTTIAKCACNVFECVSMCANGSIDVSTTVHPPLLTPQTTAPMFPSIRASLGKRLRACACAYVIWVCGRCNPSGRARDRDRGLAVCVLRYTHGERMCVCVCVCDRTQMYAHKRVRQVMTALARAPRHSLSILLAFTKSESENRSKGRHPEGSDRVQDP